MNCCPSHPQIHLPYMLTCPLCAQERRRKAYAMQWAETATEKPEPLQQQPGGGMGLPILLRLPSSLRKQILKAAKRQGKSINRLMIEWIEATLPETKQQD